jgi:hypothetical protein
MYWLGKTDTNQVNAQMVLQIVKTFQRRVAGNDDTCFYYGGHRKSL